ncbi:MAG TPA: response regulator [Ferruginibacter sp.]|nr:response regulator [Ferruginibacter sp.]
MTTHGIVSTEGRIALFTLPCLEIRPINTDPKAPTHVLLAEDDEDDVLIFRLAVDKLPIAIMLTHAQDGEQLFELLETILPDIIFLDIYMPCKNGRECIQDIRANRKYDSIPVIMYTSSSERNVVDETFRAGANLFVVKPNNIRELTEKLQHILAINWKEYMVFPPRKKFLVA